jgi:integrase
MVTRRNIYGKARLQDVTKDFIDKNVQIPLNKAILWEYIMDFVVRNTSAQRRRKIIGTYLTLESKGVINTPLQQYTSSEFVSSIQKINALTTYIASRGGYTKTYTESTKTDFRRWFKQFYHWYKSRDIRFNDSTKSMQMNQFYETVRTTKRGKQGTSYTKEDMYTYEDLEMFCRLANQINRRALLEFLFYTGCRVEEALNVRLKHLDRSGPVWQVTLKGKNNKTRIVPIIEPMPVLRELIQDLKSPTGDTTLFNKGRDKFNPIPMDHAYVTDIFLRIKTRIRKINPSWNKPLHAHHFRRTWCTMNRKHVSERTIKQLGGWSLSSTVNIYDYTDNDDAIKEYSKGKGINIKEKPTKTIWTCALCDRTNAPHVSTCECGRPKDLATYLGDMEPQLKHQQVLREFLDEICSNPELMKRFNEFKQNIA